MPTPTPKPTVDPSSTLLPDLAAFFRRKLTRDFDYFGNGHNMEFESVPVAAYDTLLSEVLSLLSEPQYQLELIELAQAPYYSGKTELYYIFNYTGSSPEISEATVNATATDDYFSFDVALRIKPGSGNTFRIGLLYCNTFDVEDSSKHTTLDIREGSDGSIITEDIEDPVVGEYDRSEKDCFSCRGSGRCTNCGGTDTVRKFQAGLGWVDQNCTWCSSGRCSFCNRTEKD